MAESLNFGQMGLSRLRQNQWIRELVSEYTVSVSQMIQPLFVVEGLSAPEEVPGLTGTFRETPDSLLRTIDQDLERGVRKFILFGVPGQKKLHGFSSDFTAQQIRAIRKRYGKDLFLAVDVCLCSYTEHGHCGVMSAEGDHLDNMASVDELSKLALAYAQAGADCVAPSDMMDGRIGSIRSHLDSSGLNRTLLMSYSAKFHSKFYGPFRVAADSAPKHAHGLKDRATYQLDPASPKDALACCERDVQEGADILMVKPGLPYLDILARLSDQIKKPWAVYQVSGEFASIEVLAQKSLIQRAAGHLEIWTAFKRAGASMIITYGARFAKEFLNEVQKA